jgi:hypothetical protein
MKKMKMKDFEFKQFFIQKGEKVGLWVCVGILVLLVVFTVKDMLGVPSASANADEIQELSKKGKNLIASSQPTEDIKVVPEQIRKADSPQPVPENLFAMERPLFDGGATEDRKWRSPAVLAMDDWRVDYLLAPVPSLIISHANNETLVAALVPKNDAGIKRNIDEKAEAKRKARLEKRLKQLGLNSQQMQQLLQQRGGPGGMGGPPGMGGPMGGMRGMGGMGGPPGMGGPGGMGGPPGMGGPGGMGGANSMAGMMSRMGGSADRMKMLGQSSLAFGGSTGPEYELKPLPEDKVGNFELAEEIQPYRMVLISAAFPYKQQLEQFRQALRFTDIEKMLADPKLPGGLEFAGINVQRRQGRPGESLANKPWVDLPIETAMKHVMILAVEPDKSEQDQKLEQMGIIVRPNRLVMPRPKLDEKLHKEKYPEELPQSVQESLTAMEQASKGKTPVAQKKKSRFDLAEYSLFGDEDTSPGADPNQTAAGTNREGSLQNTQETARPDKILVRFYDTTVEPGMNYQYRVQVRMANPNYKNEKAVTKNITLDKEIRGAWAELSQTVRIPDETFFYAVDEKRTEGTFAYNDRVAMQVHRWLEKLQTDPNNRGSVVLVGDWSILEQDWVRRGEYVGGVKETDVPIWWPTFKKYLFALHPDQVKKRAPGAPRTSRRQGVPIDFDTHALLVDFEGGKRSYQVGANKFVDESPIEVLVLNKGKLMVHDSKVDSENDERKKRVEEWKTTLKTVKEEADNKSPTGKPGSFDNLIGAPGKKGSQ